MSVVSGLRRGLNPLLLQVTSVVVGAAVVIGIAQYTSDVVRRSSRNATNDAQAALLAAEITAEIDSMSLALVFSTVLAGEDQPQQPFNNLTMGDAILAHDAVIAAEAKAKELHALIGSEATLQIRGAAVETSESLDAYIQSPSQDTFVTVLLPRLAALRFLAATESPRLQATAEGHQGTLLDASSNARLATIVAAFVSAAAVGVATLVIGRRLRRALEAARREQAQLMEASAVMQRRNDQFGALYQVVSEVTETLSMRYVVQTTVREARKLVGADAVVVRRLEDNDLILAASDYDPQYEPDDAQVISLGTGLVGRSAKRGKTIRVDEAVAKSKVEAEGFAAAESALIVPLIVGARVVGALACWSHNPHQFNSDDERILEMMASQVATALAAAGVHEETQHDAHHDALTMLANRRQLTEDLRGVLLEEAGVRSSLAVTMVDIDHFKRFNDDYGHRVGDIALQKVSEVLRASIREQDHLYRFGGEEFVAIFTGVGEEKAMQLAERMRAAVERTTLTGENLQPVGPITISVGVALYPNHGKDLDDLIDRADRAMYSSKEMGRNRVTRAGEEPAVVSAAA